MKLYYSKGACSLAVRIALHEANIASEFESVDFKTKKTETGEDYLTINPKGSVPALRLDDNTILTENAAIQQYLADHAHASKLLPEVGNLKRYRVLEWLSFLNSDVHKSFGPLFNPDVPEDTKEKIFRPLLLKRFNVIEKHLEKNKFLMGNEYTLPDGYLLVVLRWLPAVKIDIKSLPNLARYMKEVMERKSVAQALKEEGLATA